MLITTHLEMISREQFRPDFLPPRAGNEIIQVEAPSVDFYRFLYKSVGYHLRWRDRLIMPDAELNAILCSADVRIYVLYVQGVPGGYIELAQQGKDTEIAYLGLFPQYYGYGLGKHLLSFGIQQAWDSGAQRVWVHTCNLDGDFALANYTKRGFQVYHVEEEPMPERYRV
jgi:GNAT superfamily N-acetyltransferase